MNFLKKLFSGSDKINSGSCNPDNTNLNRLLEIYSQNPSDNNYKAVVEEISNGNGFVLLPSINDDHDSKDWNNTEDNMTLNLTSVFNLDGLKVLGAFSDEESLLKWTNRQTTYTALKTQDLVGLCQANNIDRIVINSDQPTMFVLERNRENIQTVTITEDTEVLVGTPLKPLPKVAITKLTENFSKVDTIEEAYQYAQHIQNQKSLVLGIKMSIVSDNSKAALFNALNDSLEGIDVGVPIDIMLLEDEGWLTTVRNIEDALFYKR